MLWNACALPTVCWICWLCYSQGIDKSTAQRILGIWRQSGATSPEALRKLFIKRSISKSTRIGLQLLVDLAAGTGAFYAARVGSSAAHRAS